jgi:hypothetical protein
MRQFGYLLELYRDARSPEYKKNTYNSISVGGFDVELISNDTPEVALMYNSQIQIPLAGYSTLFDVQNKVQAC